MDGSGKGTDGKDLAGREGMDDRGRQWRGRGQHWPWTVAAHHRARNQDFGIETFFGTFCPDSKSKSRNIRIGTSFETFCPDF